MTTETGVRATPTEAAPVGALRRSAQQTRELQLVVTVAAAGAAIGAALSPAHPTASPVVDIVYKVTFAVLVTVAGAAAGRAPWLVATGIATGFSRGAWVAPAAVAMALAFGSVWVPRRRQRVGAVIGALAVQSVLRFPAVGFHGATALAAAAAVAPLLFSAYRHSPRRWQRRCRRALTATVGVLGLLAVLFVVATLLAHRRIGTGIDRAAAAYAAAHNADDSGFRADLGRAASAFGDAHDLTGSWWTAATRLVPVVSQHRYALTEATGLARRITRDTGRALDTTGYDRLHYRDGSVDVDRVAAAARPLTAAAATLQATGRQLGRIDEPWLLAPIRRRLQTLDRRVADLAGDTRQAAAAARVVPGMFGADGTRQYFVGFVDPAESRGLGGVIQSYAVVSAHNGRLTVTRSGPVTDLDRVGGPRTLSGLTDYEQRYGNFDPARHLEDATYSPDLPTVARAIGQLYRQSGGSSLDGVLVVDPSGLAQLLRYTGPVTVTGLDRPLTSANAAEVLLRPQSAEVAADAVRATFERLAAGTLPGPRALAHDLAGPVAQGQLGFVSFHPAEARYLHQIGLDRAFPRVHGDDLVAVTTQAVGTSPNSTALSRRLTVDVFPGLADDNAISTVTVTLTNRATTAARQWLTLYSPLHLSSALEQGPVLVQSSHELGLNTYSTYVDVPARGTVKLTFGMGGQLRSPYRLHLVAQPQAQPELALVRIHTSARLVTWRGPLAANRLVTPSGTTEDRSGR